MPQSHDHDACLAPALDATPHCAAREAADYFSLPIDFRARFDAFDPVPLPAPRPDRSVPVPGTLAYWRFDDGTPAGTALPDGKVIPDLSGHGNDLTRVTVGGGPSVLAYSAEYHVDQPAHASLYFQGGANKGAYLRTADHAPLNVQSFASGYTVEAFLKLPKDFVLASAEAAR